MKSTLFALLSLVMAAPFQSSASQRLIPAGSLIQCTIAEPKISSKTESVGDPIVCQVGHAGYRQHFGSSILPYDSYLVGQFEAYKDPGHLVGKGWMQLTFDRMVIEPDTIVLVNAKVVGVPGYSIDREGRIHGKGHAVKDTVEWSIPILWPIDVINLPRRGPRPTLKTETRLMLKVMDDLAIPMGGPSPGEEYNPHLLHRAPSAYTLPRSEPGSFVETSFDPSPVSDAPSVAQKPARPEYKGSDNRETVTLVFKDGRPPERVQNFMLTPTTVYVIDSSSHRIIPLRDLDLAATKETNQEAGVEFRVPGTRSE
jgi:hypothetical protein